MPDFSEFLSRGKRGHLIGIGGVSMSPLAEVLCDAGLVISGSDIAESERTSHLREKGIKIFIGHDAEPRPLTTITRRSSAQKSSAFRCLSALRRGAP